jgi:hypothetical protein
MLLASLMIFGNIFSNHATFYIGEHPRELGEMLMMFKSKTKNHATFLFVEHPRAKVHF